MLAIQEYAMDLLTKAHQTTLPIDEEAVARWLGAKVHPYSVGRGLLTSAGCWDYARTVQGLSICHNGVTCIFYSDQLSALERRSVILHECGHIYLKHLADGCILGKSGNHHVDAAQEREANAFALFALAPPALLSRLNVTTADGIARICRISTQDAQTVAAQMQRAASKRRPLRLVLAAALAVVAVLLLLWSCRLQAQRTHVIPTSPNTTVYITRSGDHYHRPDCYHIAGHDPISIDLVDAIRSGYTPCRACRPDQP